MAKSNQFENKILKDINLTEGFLTKLLAKIFKPRVDKTLNKFVKAMVDDPELQAKLADLKRMQKDLYKSSKNYCKKRPHSPLCDPKTGRRKSTFNI